MAYDLEHRLVIGVSSRALFDLSVENELFETQGVEAYCRYQVEHEKDYLMPGNGFRLIEALLNINKIPGQEGRVEVIIMSHNSPDTHCGYLIPLRITGCRFREQYWQAEHR